MLGRKGTKRDVRRDRGEEEVLQGNVFKEVGKMGGKV